MTTVLDKGPQDPKTLTTEQKADPAALKKYNDDVAEAAAWHKANNEPVKVTMSPIDAQHAAAADPERYSIVPDGPKLPVTLDERVADLEARVEEIAPREKRVAQDKK